MLVDNPTTDEAGNTYVYDAWNRLYSYTHSGSAKTYSYDALGRRIGETASGSATHLYCSANWQVLEERLTAPNSVIPIPVGRARRRSEVGESNTWPSTKKIAQGWGLPIHSPRSQPSLRLPLATRDAIAVAL